MEDWRHLAACKGMPTEDFMCLRIGDKGTKRFGKNTYRLRKFNLERLEKAQGICEGCPVKDLCLRDSNLADRHWSVRGGVLPKALVSPHRSPTPPNSENDQHLPRCYSEGLSGSSNGNYRAP